MCSRVSAIYIIKIKHNIKRFLKFFVRRQRGSRGKEKTFPLKRSGAAMREPARENVRYEFGRSFEYCVDICESSRNTRSNSSARINNWCNRAARERVLCIFIFVNIQTRIFSFPKRKIFTKLKSWNCYIYHGALCSRRVNNDKRTFKTCIHFK